MSNAVQQPMARKLTKKLVKSLVKEYIDDAIDKPPNQPEPRFAECFDKSIDDEMYLTIKDIENIRSIEDLRRIVRFIMQIAEEHADEYKRVRVVSEDIAYARGEIVARVPSRE
jgi:histone H3/H4